MSDAAPQTEPPSPDAKASSRERPGFLYNVRHATDDNGVVNATVVCRGCRYNLRGLKWDAHCPECGLPVLDSIANDHLVYADDGWLRGMVRGFDLVMWGIALGLAMLVLLAMFRQDFRFRGLGTIW